MTILEEAHKLTMEDRRQEYGDAAKNFDDVAKIWSVLLDVKVTALQVTECMIALKLCRAKTGYKRDTIVDIAGYARCAEMIHDAEINWIQG